MTTKTYVLNDTEVRMTGRVARKDGNRAVAAAELVEVTPADENDGTWKKWVPQKTLFEIIAKPE